MASLVRIRNTASVSRSIIRLGTQISLDAGAEQIFDSEVANAFLDKHPDVLSVNLGGIFEPNVQAERMWIANMTGDPDSEHKVEKKLWNKGRWELKKVDNPKKNPRTLRYSCEQGMQEYTGKSGVLEALNLAPVIYVIPPFSRIEVPEHIGRWLKMMDGTSEPESRKTVIQSRRPGSFEPTAEWTLDDLRVYLKCMDAKARTGKGEIDIKEMVLKRKGTGIKSKPNTKAQADLEVFEAKEAMLKRIHFRLVDPRYTVPTMVEFNELKSGPQAEPEDPADLLAEAQGNTAFVEGITDSATAPSPE